MRIVFICGVHPELWCSSDVVFITDCFERNKIYLYFTLRYGRSLVPHWLIILGAIFTVKRSNLRLECGRKTHHYVADMGAITLTLCMQDVAEMKMNFNLAHKDIRRHRWPWEVGLEL